MAFQVFLPNVRAFSWCRWGILCIVLGSFFLPVVSYAMYQEPHFALGAETLFIGAKPADYGYQCMPLKEKVTFPKPQKVVVHYPQRHYTFALLDGVGFSTEYKRYFAKIRLIEQGKEKLIALYTPQVYVHPSWIDYSESLSGWLSKLDSFIPGATFITKKNFSDRSQYVSQLIRRLLKEGSWYNGDDSFLDSSVDKDQWYVEKLRITKDETVFVFGDFHGDIYSLLQALKKLAEDGYLADNFALKSKTHLVFLGDYTDRGDFGLEVLYLLLKLKLANFSQVTLLRGNHENRAINQRYGFERELKNKLALSDDECNALVYNLYDLLPAALYIGFEGEKEKTAWGLFCHGGLEIGFSARGFLQSDTTYCFIKELKRDFYVRQLPEDLQREVFSASPAMPTSDMQESGAEEPKEIFAEMTSEIPEQIGFLWNDFIFEGDRSYVRQVRRGAALGKRLTKELLHRDGLGFVMRGHQHAGNFLEELYREGGCVSSFDGMVNTLISGNVNPNRPLLNYSYAGFSYYKAGASNSAWWQDLYCSGQAKE